MRRVMLLLTALLLLQVLSVTPIEAQAKMSGQRESETIVDRKMASDGVTEGWLVAYPNPDPHQSWRKIMGTLVIAQHGRVIRRIGADSTFWSWNFWDGGRKVAYQMGPLHGETVCVLADARSGKEVDRWAGDCRNRPDNAPSWVKAADGQTIR